MKRKIGGVPFSWDAQAAPWTKGGKTALKLWRQMENINKKLKIENSELASRARIDKFGEVTNSLASLAAGTASANALGQSPMTSFGPMLKNNMYAPLTIDWTILIYAYKTHGIIQTLVDQPVLDAFRGGLEIRSSELSEKEIGILQDVMERKGVLDVIIEAFTWARLFGGAAIILSDDTPMDSPLDYKALARQGRRVVDFYAANRWELGSAWRTAKQYQVYGKIVDGSKVMTIMGKQAPYILRWQLAGWGMSELERVVPDFNQYIRVKNVIYELLYEAKVDVYKFQDFANQMLSSDAENRTNNRLAMMNQFKTYNSALLLDREDEFEQKQLRFNGLAEIYRESRLEMAAALRMPMTKIFGIAASGFNSGEADIENYNSMITSEVRRPARPVIRRVLEVLCASLFGRRVDIDFDFMPLRILGAVDEEAVKTSKLARLLNLFDRGIISDKELKDLAHKERLFGSGIQSVGPKNSDLVKKLDLADMPEREFAGQGKSMPGVTAMPGTRAGDSGSLASERLVSPLLKGYGIAPGSSQAPNRDLSRSDDEMKKRGNGGKNKNGSDVRESEP
ncbi:MAG: DUF1073 domain-containing protein [Patescibacteria group bacterium]|nr:DUF1073 domain-containing protein [Patescibacteria group bacterium]